MLCHLILGIFTIVQLNCENLFDCSHDSLKQDMEYADTASLRHWNHYRYSHKLKNIAKEILACSRRNEKWQTEIPDLITLCEVENDSVVDHLIRRTPLWSSGYKYVVTNSPDLRGIDVAMLYSPFTFHLLRSYPLRVDMPKGKRPTRDILYAAGMLMNGDTLHVFVVHAPSRYEGKRASEPYRMLVAERLMQSVDSIRAVSANPSIIVAGDFNDGSTDKPLLYLQEQGLTDVSKDAPPLNEACGTYKYQGIWQSIDHILMSGALLPRLTECRIFDLPFLLEEDTKYGGRKPLRTYYGYRYLGGFSDHLPLVARLRIE